MKKHRINFLLAVSAAGLLISGCANSDRNPTASQGQSLNRSDTGAGAGGAGGSGTGSGAYGGAGFIGGGFHGSGGGGH